MGTGLDLQGPGGVDLMDHLLSLPLYDMFVPPISLLEKMLRPLLVYVFLVFSFKLAGKRLLAQLNPFDLVVILILSNTVQNAIIGNDNSITGGVLGAATLLLANGFVVKKLYTHQQLQEWLEGKPDPLIENGQLIEPNLKRENLLKSELVTAANKQGFDSLADIERALLAPGGALWFFRRTPTQDDQRQKELLERLDRIEKRLERLP
jgi:uncharacterized membrane protein YcaP (DUF421 family)